MVFSNSTSLKTQTESIFCTNLVSNRVNLNQRYGSGSTLKKEARSELRSIWLFEEPEAEAIFIKHGAGMWKWKLWEAV